MRAAATAAIARWSRGEPTAVPAPSGDLLDAMMSTCVGEPVPPEYGLLLAQEMAADQAGPPAAPGQPRDEDFTVAIIGAGVSGMLAGIRLRQQGITFVIFEKAADVGGTWLQNHYPGAGVDTPSFLYSLSFFPRSWAAHFGKRDEIMRYLHELADTFDAETIGAVPGRGGRGRVSGRSPGLGGDRRQPRATVGGLRTSTR